MGDAQTLHRATPHRSLNSVRGQSRPAKTGGAPNP